MIQFMPFDECIQCGFCCTVAPCPFGQGTPCVHLSEPDVNLKRTCGLYHSILEQTKDDTYPFFHTGCSSTLFNDARDKILKFHQQTKRLNRE